MKIFYIGDIYGAIGRDMVNEYLPKLVQEEEIDLVIANGENATHGKGLSWRHYQELVISGVQVFTMGNHTYDHKEIFDYIDEVDNLVVPYNRPPVLPGQGSILVKVKGKKVRITNCLGVVFMDNRNSNPFDRIDEYLNMESDIHIIDFHGEATSEKIAMAYYVKEKAQLLVGTHTHVQTADERIIDQKIAFISDLGMTGPYLSSLGCDLSTTIKRMQGYNQRLVPAVTSGQLAGVVVEFDDRNNLPIRIKRILINDDHPY